MSTQVARHQEIELVDMKRHIERPLVLVKDGSLKGREVALISLDNPADIDVEIEKNKSLANKESKKSTLYFVAGLVSLVVLGTIAILIVFFIPPVINSLLSALTVLSSLPVGHVFTKLTDKHSEAAKNYQAKAKELEECKENMPKNEFKLIARECGEKLTLEQLLNTNRLSKKSESIKHSQIALRQEILALRA
ncbi:MAG: hypothetical protein V4487_04150 [Chlamydiota bacterium]